ncbi:retrovirus-related pol polyprotein from transposon TNT 1-94 [Tanacetum coccineum]
MRIASINGKRYVLVIVDDYSCYIWVHFLISKDKAPEEIKTFLKKNTILLQAPVIIHASVRTLNKQVVERRNRTLVEADRTMLIFYCASLFLWAKAIATACYTQNRSIIHPRFDNTPYELYYNRIPDISFLHVFGALCYPKNDREDIGKLGAKGDIGFFIGYSANSCAYRKNDEKMRASLLTAVGSLWFEFKPLDVIDDVFGPMEARHVCKMMWRWGAYGCILERDVTGLGTLKFKKKNCERALRPNYVLRSAKIRKKKMAMSLKSTPVPTKRKTRLNKTEDIVLPYDLEDISGQPRIRSINHIMTHDPFVENLSRPDGCKSDKVTVPEYMSAFINNKDLPEYRFPWGKRDIVIGRSFWLSLSCLNIGKSGWLTDQQLDV